MVNFLGSANVQKLIGLFGGPSAGAYFPHLPMWARGTLAILGPTFAAAVHAIDAWRAKISASTPPGA